MYECDESGKKDMDSGKKKDMYITGPTTRNTRNDLMIVNMGPQNKK